MFELIDKHKVIFFNVIISLLVLHLILGIYSMIHYALPKSSVFEWTTYQWNMVKFLWEPFLTGLIINIIILILLIKRFFIGFLFLFLISLYGLPSDITNLYQILTEGFVYILPNLFGILGLLEFVFAILGSIMWFKNIRYYGKKW